MQVADTTRVVLIGADEFSCSWTQKKIALNYRETSPATGTVVSIEMQQEAAPRVTAPGCPHP